MALTIGTWAPLHKSPLQQEMSHVTFTEGSEDLHKSDVSALHSDEMAQPLAYISTELSPLFPDTSALPQRSAAEEQVTSFLMLAQSSQLLVV